MTEVEEKKSNLRLRIFKKVILYGVILFVISLLGLVTLGYFYQKEIQTYIIEQFSEKLNASVSIGSVDVSFVRSFPKVSIQLTDFQVKLKSETVKKYQFAHNRVLDSPKLSIQLDLMSFLSSNYKITAVEMKEPVIELVAINKYWNIQSIFDTKKSKMPSETKKSFNVEIQKVKIYQGRFSVSNRQGGVTVDMANTDVFLSGNVGQENYQLSLEISTLFDNWTQGNVRYIKEKKVELNTKIAVNTIKKTYQFEKSVLRIENLELVIQGMLQQLAKNWEIDVIFSTEKAKFGDFLTVLPSVWAKSIEGFNVAGSFSTTGTYKGKLGNGSQPELKLKVQIMDGKLSYGEKQGSLSNLKLDGELFYSRQQPDKSFIVVNQCVGKFGADTFSGNFEFRNFKNPFIESRLKGNFDLRNLRGIVPGWQDSTETGGNIVVDIHSKGLLSDFKKANWNETFSKGTIDYQDVHIQTPHFLLPLQQLNGMIAFDKDSLSFKNLTGKLGASDFALNGIAEGYIPFLFDSASKLNAQFQLNSQHLAFSQWLTALQKPVNQDSTTVPEPTKPTNNLLSKLNIQLQTKAQTFVLQNLKGSNLTGNIHLENNTFVINDFGFQAFSGKLNASGKISASELELNTEVTDIELNTFFQTFPQLSKLIIIGDNIHGKLSAKLKSQSNLLTNKTLDPSTIQATGKINLKNGKLLDFQLLQKLIGFINIKSLKNLQFGELNSEFSVKNNRFTIKETHILANDNLRMDVVGSHGFDNKLDYYLRVFLPGIKSAKSKDKKIAQWIDEQTDDKDNSKIYLKLTGTPAQPNFKLIKASEFIKQTQ